MNSWSGWPLSSHKLPLSRIIFKKFKNRMYWSHWRGSDCFVAKGHDPSCHVYQFSFWRPSLVSKIAVPRCFLSISTFQLATHLTCITFDRNRQNLFSIFKIFNYFFLNINILIYKINISNKHVLACLVHTTWLSHTLHQ